MCPLVKNFFPPVKNNFPPEGKEERREENFSGQVWRRRVKRGIRGGIMAFPEKSSIFAAPYKGKKTGCLMRNVSYQQVEKLLTAFFFSVDNSMSRLEINEIGMLINLLERIFPPFL